MNCNTISESHPLWITKEYSKGNFEKELDKLSHAKANVIYRVKNHNIELHDCSTLQGKIIHLWHRFIGLFGGENQFDNDRVNYEFLKLLRYGISHHYFYDEKIRNLAKDLGIALADKKRNFEITDLGKKLTPKKRHLEVNAAISEIVKHFETSWFPSDYPLLQSLTQKTESYYAKNLSKLFHQQTQTLTEAAMYNTGCIQAKNGETEKAIHNLLGSISRELSEVFANKHRALFELANSKDMNSLNKGLQEDYIDSAASSLIRTAIAKNPEKVDWLPKLIEVYAKRIDELLEFCEPGSQDFLKLEFLCNDLLSLNPHTFSSGSRYYEREMINEIIATAYRGLADKFVKQNMHEKAKQYYELSLAFINHNSPKYRTFCFEYLDLLIKIIARSQEEGNVTEAAKHCAKAIFRFNNLKDSILALGNSEVLEAYEKRDYKTIAAISLSICEMFEPRRRESEETKKANRAAYTVEAVEARIRPLVEMEQRLNQARFEFIQKMVIKCEYQAVKDIWEKGIAAYKNDVKQGVADYESLFLEVYTQKIFQELKGEKQEAAIATFKEGVDLIYAKNRTCRYEAYRSLVESDLMNKLSLEQQAKFYIALALDKDIWEMRNTGAKLIPVLTQCCQKKKSLSLESRASLANGILEILKSSYGFTDSNSNVLIDSYIKLVGDCPLTEILPAVSKFYDCESVGIRDKMEYSRKIWVALQIVESLQKNHFSRKNNAVLLQAELEKLQQMMNLCVLR